MARSPAVAAMLHRARALAAAGRAEAALPPAELAAEVWNLPAARPYALGDAEMFMLELRQRWPAAGARDALAQAMAEESAMALAEAVAERQAVAQRASDAYIAHAQARAERALLASQLDVLQRMVLAQGARVTSGGATLSERPRLELEQSKLRRARLRAEEELASAAAELRALLRLSADASLGDLPPLASETVAEVAPEALAEVLARTAAHRGAAQAAAARERAAELRLRAARSEARWPEIMLGVGLWQDPHMRTGFGVSAAMSLPWLSGLGRARVDKARAERAEVRARASATAQDAQVELAMALARLRSQEAQLAEVRERSLPAARRSVEAATSAYSTGAVSLLEWLDVTRMELELELELLALAGQQARALAALDRAAGQRLPRVPLPPGGAVVSSAGAPGDVSEHRTEHRAGHRTDAASPPAAPMARREEEKP